MVYKRDKVPLPFIIASFCSLVWISGRGSTLCQGLCKATDFYCFDTKTGSLPQNEQDVTNVIQAIKQYVSHNCNNMGQSVQGNLVGWGE